MSFPNCPVCFTSLLNGQRQGGHREPADRRYATYADWRHIAQKGRNIYKNLTFELWQNGCAAFVLVISLYVVQHDGMTLSWTALLLWLLVSVASAVKNEE